MGKKGKLYVIVFINLLAWGFVGYKVYGALQGDDEVQLMESAMPVKKIKETIKEEHTSLSLNYPDPFLKSGDFSNAHGTHNVSAPGYNKPSQVKSIPAISKSAASVSTTPKISIKYLGLLKNNDKGTQTAMLNINDRSVFARQNDVVEGYTVISISKESIKIKKGKEVLTIDK